MSDLRVALLNASYNDERTDRNFERVVDADVRSFAANDGRLPADFAYDAVIVTGSAASVYWDEEWIEPLADWVREAVDRGMPTLGVCFGHQLVAHALGGEVRDMGEYELGYHDVERVGESVLLSGLSNPFVVFETHSDEVVTLPPGATLTATNEYSIQGFEREPAFGVQFHPEYDRDTAAYVTRSKDLPDDQIHAALETITDENVAAARSATSLFDTFLEYAASRAHRKGEPDR